jgi:hypothetical protein
MEHDLKKVRNLKLIISAFKQLSGLKINFHQSEFFCFGEVKDDANLYAKLSDVGLEVFQLAILAARYIIGGSLWLNGKWLRKDYISVLVAGKENYYLWMED